MRSGQRYARALVLIGLAVVAALAAYACGATSITQTSAPDNPRCQIALSAKPSSLGPDGGTVSIAISTTRDCTWTAKSEAAWIRLSNGSGQGEATLTATVDANPDITARSANVDVNSQKTLISQDARPCTYSIAPTSVAIPGGGGSGHASVTTLNGCAWHSSSDQPWIHVPTDSRTGAGGVDFTVDANTGASRSGTITIAGQQFTVTEDAFAPPAPGPAPPPTMPAPDCTATLAPALLDVVADASTQTIQLQIGPTCAWSASSDSAWLTISPPASGRGSAAIPLAVAANTTTSQRTAVVTVAGRQSTIRQAAAPAPAPCTYSISPTSQSVTAGGGTGTFTVTSATGCTWTASSNVSWVTITSGASGTGSGTVAFSVQANTTSTSRSTTIAAAGQSFAINQDAPAPTPCSYSISPTSLAIGASGGQGQFTLTTQSGCTWTAMANVSWISVTTASGTGSGTVSYTVQSNTATTSRTGTVTAGDQTHTVTQDAAPAPQPCTYTLDPTSGSVTAAGGQGQFQVTTQAGCAWTATTSASWVTINSGSGTGSGSVTYTVQSNTDAMARSTTIAVGGQSYTLNQDAATSGSSSP